jgi:uncharacterized protein
MDFEWDVDKAKTNFRDHGVRFEESTTVLEDLHATTVVDDDSDPSEERYVTMGMGAKGRVLVVVYVYRDDTIRIISARKAEPHELDSYGSEL